MSEDKLKVGDLVVYKHENPSDVDKMTIFAIGKIEAVVMRWDSDKRERVKESIPLACLKKVQAE